MRSQARQNSRISVGVPSDTRMYFFHGGNRRSHQDIIFFEVRNHFADRPQGIQKHEIGVGIDSAKHAGVHLVHEFLAIVRVAFRCHLHVCGVVQRGDSRLHRNDGHAVLQAERGKASRRLFGRYGVADAQTSETVNFGERSCHDGARIVERMLQKW